MKTSLKNRIGILSLLLRFSQVAQLLKERNFGQKLEKGPRPSLLTEIRKKYLSPYRPRSQVNFYRNLLSRKFTEKRDARAELLFC